MATKTLMNTNSSELNEWAESRETSIEIAQVIFENSTTLEQAEELWQNPSNDDHSIILMLAFDKTEDEELCWGCTTYFE